MTESEGFQFKALLMQWGPIPPSGGPHRDRYLDHHGRDSLRKASEAYAEVLALLGRRVPQMPDLPSPLVEANNDLRRQIQQEKRIEWIEFRASLEQATLDAIEPHIRTSVSASMAALNYLEDHPMREDAHEAIHCAAFVKRGLFGCPIVLRDDKFWTDCPINLSHLRVGFSVGLVSDFECSICGRLVEDCDHQMGQPYRVVAKRDGTGVCSICGAVDCEHTPGEEFLVEAYANARNAKASEVSMVPRPRYPQARIVEITKNLGSASGDPRVRYAAEHEDLNCDADLGPCNGFNDMRDWQIQNWSEGNNDPA